MAIDPSLSLQVTTPQVQMPSAMDWVKMGNMAQQNLMYQAETKNLQDTNPGIQATSTSLQQKAKSDVQDQQAKDLLIKLSADPDNQTPDGVLDPTKVYPKLMTAFPTQGAAAWKGYSDNIVGQAKTAGEAQDAFTKDLAVAAALADREDVPIDQKNLHLSQFVNNWAKTHPQLAGAITVLPGMKTIPGSPAVAPVPATEATPPGAANGAVDDYGNPIVDKGTPAKPGTPGSPAKSATIQFSGDLSPAQITALSKTPMSALQEIEAKNATSNAQSTATQTSLAAMDKDLAYLSARAGILTAGERTEWAAKSAAVKSNISIMDSAIATTVKDDRGNPLPLTAGAAVLRQLYNRGDANMALLQQGLDLIPGNTNKVWEIGVSQAKGQIAAYQAAQKQYAATIDNSVGSGSKVPSGAPTAQVQPNGKVGFGTTPTTPVVQPTVAPTATAKPAAEAMVTVRKKADGPNGPLYQIPASRLKSALSTGNYIQVPGQ